MNPSTLLSSNALFRATLKSLAFVVALSVAVFSASAGYGLLGGLVQAMSRGSSIGLAEFSTHSGVTVTFFVLAGLGAYLAKKCWHSGGQGRAQPALTGHPNCIPPLSREAVSNQAEVPR